MKTQWPARHGCGTGCVWSGFTAAQSHFRVTSGRKRGKKNVCLTALHQLGFTLHFTLISSNALNRSGEVTTKPGSCPTADGLYRSSVDCELDIDCPGWQKCCQRWGRSFCSDPASSANYFKNKGCQWNATVTVKTDYQQLMSKDDGLRNHTRLLQAMVTGALESEVSIYYFSSWPVHPYRTATSLLIGCNFTLSLYDVTSKLHLLLKHIPEVSSVTVEDMDECEHPALHQCSLQADCNNTMGSYQCVCHQGYTDVDPNNPGVYCTAQVAVWNTTGPPLTHLPLMNATFTPSSNGTQDPPGNGTVGLLISSETSVITPLSNTSSVTYNSSNASRGTSSVPFTSMSTAAESTLPTCQPAIITSLWSANVTGAAITISWSSQFQTNQTFRVTLSKESEVIYFWETSQTMTEMRGLQPGVLYNLTVTPCVCGREGAAHHMMIKTDAQTLGATTRLSNIQFTADLRNSSSQSHQNLTKSFIEEIYQSLSPEMKVMLDSGQMRVEVRGFSPGSVVVDFTIILNPVQSYEIINASTALVQSLMNSSKYVVDARNTSIKDFDECASGENDCSVWASCINTWASFTCACIRGFIDNNPKRPGRTCQANASLDMTPAPSVATFSTVGAAPSSEITPPATALVKTTITETQDVVSTAFTTTAHAPTTSTTPLSTVFHLPAINSAALTTTSVPTTTISTSAITTTSSTSTSTSSTLRSAANASLQGAISVQCRVASITTTVAKDFLVNANVQESALYLGMMECGVNGGNDTHVQLTVAWNECATILVHNDTYYTASATLFSTMDPYKSPNGTMEVPRIQLKVPIMCTYLRSALISADFGSMGYDMIKDVLVGMGSFPVIVQLMNGTSPLPQNYSLAPKEPLVLEVGLKITSEQIKVVINKCWATPTQNPADPFTYTFLENSCPLNIFTQVLMNGNSTTSRVSVQIFSFISLNVIYLHCQVQICVEIGSDTCVPDCLQRKARTAARTVRTVFGSFGPVTKPDDESLEDNSDILHIVGLSCLGVGLSLFFIIGFVCLFYCQRNRIGHYNFNVKKPKEETFTYLDVHA
ncbi:uromodulin-like 1 [Cololabis saira]|uniref:uromodulin-like 1 n=1 Tax=Cololabis saira TaxID=129043 RepID=UPI002AD505EC|nr:uromodulin-like 1 [Cololabis saira]